MIIIIIFAHQHKATDMEIKLSKNNDHDGVSHGVESSQEATAFPLKSNRQALEQEHRLFCVSVTAVMRLPISWISSVTDWFQAPAVSTATGKKVRGRQRTILDNLVLCCLVCC